MAVNNAPVNKNSEQKVGVVFNLGCKVNGYEGQAILAALVEAGFIMYDTLVPADFYVLNTCSVTAEADRKSRQAVARAKRCNPDARVYVCGCSSQNAPAAFAAKKGVRIVSGVAGKGELAARIIADLTTDEPPQSACAPLPASYEDDLFPRPTKTRGILKIQDGCNRFCSYCIIPYLRGRSRSRPVASVVAEAEKAAAHTRELVLAGIDLSAYGKDIGTDLPALLRALEHVPCRLRLGSLECSAITSALLQAMREGGVCDHFHLSLQSGSESVLRRMNRRYTPTDYARAVQRIRAVFPHAGITTDVIAGFCEETDAEHAETVDFVRSIGFSQLHVFPYSERQGTAACKLHPVDPQKKAERTAELLEVGKRLQHDFLRASLGQTHQVYLETRAGDLCVGYTKNYLKVYTAGTPGTVVSVRLQKIYKEGVLAQ